MNKVKAEKDAAEKTGASSIDRWDISGGRARGSKACDRSDDRHRAHAGALEGLGDPKLLGLMTVTRTKKRPDGMECVEESGRRGGGRTVGRNGTETPSTTMEWRPGATDPQGTAEDSMGKRGSQEDHGGSSRVVKETLEKDSNVQQRNFDDG
jgi:hypothetical protein